MKTQGLDPTVPVGFVTLSFVLVGVCSTLACTGSVIAPLPPVALQVTGYDEALVATLDDADVGATVWLTSDELERHCDEARALVEGGAEVGGLLLEGTSAEAGRLARACDVEIVGYRGRLSRADRPAPPGLEQLGANYWVEPFVQSAAVQGPLPTGSVFCDQDAEAFGVYSFARRSQGALTHIVAGRLLAPEQSCADKHPHTPRLDRAGLSSYADAMVAAEGRAKAPSVVEWFAQTMASPEHAMYRALYADGLSSLSKTHRFVRLRDLLDDD